MTVYYFGYKGKKTRPFPPGFHIVVGNPKRTREEQPVIDRAWSYPISNPQGQEELAKKSIGFLCMEHPKYKDYGTFEKQDMYDRADMDLCAGGFQANIATRPCWNGKFPEDPTDQSHLAFASMPLDGECPDSHPERLPTLLFENTYQVDKFRGVPGYYMFNTGDTKGIIFHLLLPI
jgi:hypothetical protein